MAPRNSRILKLIKDYFVDIFDLRLTAIPIPENDISIKNDTLESIFLYISSKVSERAIQQLFHERASDIIWL